jgi:hypothetical protein
LRRFPWAYGPTIQGLDEKLTDMGRAFYRFGQDVALRLANGEAFALRDVELGAIFGAEKAPVCLLRGTFSAATYRALVARGVLEPNSELQALAQPVAVQLGLIESLAATVGKDAKTLSHVGRRLSQNSATDELARNLLTLEQWHLVSATPVGQPMPVPSTIVQFPAVADSAQEAAITEMITDLASELWVAAEEAGAAAQAPVLTSPLDLFQAVTLFFAEEEWGWEIVGDSEGLLRTIYDGQNGSWLCYTNILPDLDQVIFYSTCPVTVPAPALPAMTDYLSRLNATLSLGNFEVEFVHSVVRFRTSVDVTDVGLAPLLFRNLVYQNLAVMDLYLPEILAIVAGSQPIAPID